MNIFIGVLILIKVQKHKFLAATNKSDNENIRVIMKMIIL
jgi:hypothetical protein